MKLELKVSQRHVAGLTEAQMEALTLALETTTHYILGMRDGSCYRFEDSIEDARRVVQNMERREEKSCAEGFCGGCDCLDPQPPKGCPCPSHHWDCDCDGRAGDR